MQLNWRIGPVIWVVLVTSIGVDTENVTYSSAQ